ncbi:MAG: threonine/serine ThrE exporter family protein, partial [Blastocatellia bacterium]
MTQEPLECPPVEDRANAVGFTIKLFRALHQYGTPTYRLEQIMSQVSQRLGLQGQFFSLPTGIFLSFGAPEEQRATLIRVEPSSVDLGKLGMLHELTRRIIHGEVGPDEGTVEVERITSSLPAYGSVSVVIAYGIASGVGPVFFGGGWHEISVASVIGLILGVISLIVGRSEDASRVFEPLAAVIASALAMVGARVFPPVSVYIATLAGLLVLFPGLTLTVAIRELATRNLVSGTAQLTGTTVVFLELAFGVALGSQIDRVLPAVHLVRHTVPLVWWAQWVALAISPLAFGILLKSRRKDLPWILLAGAIGFSGTRAGAALVGPELGAFIGALLLGLGSNVYGRVF